MKSKAELRIERMYELEKGVYMECRDVLRRLYALEDKSIDEIAKHFITSYNTINKLIKKYNISKIYEMV